VKLLCRPRMVPATPLQGVNASSVYLLNAAHRDRVPSALRVGPFGPFAEAFPAGNDQTNAMF
jgi:hypothetical protein